MPIYSQCKAAARIAADIIEKHHPDLHKAGVKVVWIFRDRAGKSGGRIVLGRASKRSSRDRFLTDVGAHVIVEISEDQWDEMNPQQREALIDHELCHIKVVTRKEAVLKGTEDVEMPGGQTETRPIYEENTVVLREDDGSPKLQIVGHDLDEFRAVLVRHGIWRSDPLDALHALATAGTELQARLFGADPADVLSSVPQGPGPAFSAEDVRDLDDDGLAALAKLVREEQQVRAAVAAKVGAEIV